MNSSPILFCIILVDAIPIPTQCLYGHFRVDGMSEVYHNPHNSDILREKNRILGKFVKNALFVDLWGSNISEFNAPHDLIV